mmetsp:Transcript_1491/g.3534  ORF Transcript_1491/g.3534 Transcript_1491/m.3534 type:complete len:386 (-) Transcript_1491:348-1505(-)
MLQDRGELALVVDACLVAEHLAGLFESDRASRAAANVHKGLADSAQAVVVVHTDQLPELADVKASGVVNIDLIDDLLLHLERYDIPKPMQNLPDFERADFALAVRVVPGVGIAYVFHVLVRKTLPGPEGSQELPQLAKVELTAFRGKTKLPGHVIDHDLVGLVAQCFKYVSELFRRDGTTAVCVVLKHDRLDSLYLPLANLPHAEDKLLLTDRAAAIYVHLFDDLVELLVVDMEAKPPQDSRQLLRVDGSGFVVVKPVEDVPEHLTLPLRKALLPLNESHDCLKLREVERSMAVAIHCGNHLVQHVLHGLYAKALHECRQFDGLQQAGTINVPTREGLSVGVPLADLVLLDERKELVLPQRVKGGDECVDVVDPLLVRLWHPNHF